MMTSKSISYYQNVWHEVCCHVKKYAITVLPSCQKCITQESSSWRQTICSKVYQIIYKYAMTSKCMEIYHGVKKFVHDDKKCVMCVMTSKSLWCQKVSHDVKISSWRKKKRYGAKKTSWRSKVRHDVKEWVMTSKTCYDETNSWWRHQYVMTSKSSSWRRKVHHNVNNS